MKKLLLIGSIILLAGCTPLSTIIVVSNDVAIEPQVFSGQSENPTIIITTFPKTQGTYWF